MNKFQPNIYFLILLGMLILSAGTVHLNAQEVKPVKIEPVPPTTGITPPKKEDRPKPIKEVLPDAQKIDGLITLYRKKEKLYAEIKNSNLNTDYLIAMAIAKGSGWNAIGGYTLQDSDEDWLWQFRKVNESIQIVRRNIRFKADSGTPEAKAVEVAYSDSILYSLPILAVGDNDGDVIDMASVFMSDLPKLGRDIGGSFARDRSTWGDIKGFPNNIEFRVVATYSAYRSYSNSADSPDASSVGVTIHYSVSKLPSTGYFSRLADNRIGYFTTTHKNFSRNEKDDHLVRYINRWNIQKADATATLSPPKKPVVFWIEKTVPFKYRHAVREGILEWNKAFEKIGIVNAIEVRQQSDTDNWDAEDINYNTIRWITSDAGFAMGPSHVNPLTGEILDADIIIDAGFIDHWKDRFDYFIADLIPPDSDKKNDAASLFKHRRKERENAKNVASHCGLNGCYCTDAQNKATQIALASLAVSLIDEDSGNASDEEENKEKEDKENGKADENSGEKTDEKSGDKSEETKEPEKTDKKDVEEDGKKEDAEKEKEKNENDNSKNDEKKDEKKDTKKTSKQEKEKAIAEKLERIILAGVKDLVMHEVGHTLGLRHNFKASSWQTLEEINKPDRSKEFGIAGSVMDYLPINVAPKGQPQGDYFMSALGPYDYLAIEYGYKIISGIISGGIDGELKELQKIAARQAENGRNFATDEDIIATDSDPLTSTRDLGSNPLDYAKTATARYEQLLPELLDRAVKEGGSYKDVGRFFRLLVFDRTSANYVLARNVAGLYVNRDHRGDPSGRPPIQVVDAKTQRDSLDYICKTIFAADSFKISHDVYNRFGEEKWLHWNYQIYGSQTWTLSDLILYVRLYLLSQLLDPLTLERLEETQLRVAENDDVYTIDELFETLTDTIFKELETIKEGEFTARKPAIGLLQRMLQNNYFDILSLYSLGELPPLSSQSVARQQLTSLSSNIQVLLTGKAKLDTATRTHLLSLQERIRKVLDANIIRYNP
ncbi:MAG: zinc-dependent metalloprotease [Planctomycetaceae bacterium]|jgi:hypothetical protein|nr:zinc-dependent metalloprotease [Planctomycetaceae bacterium]